MTRARASAMPADVTPIETIAPRDHGDSRRAFSGRPTTVRFSTELQKRLAVAAQVSQKSVSELMREGAEHVVDKYVGADAETAAATIRATAEASAARMRELYGLSDAG